MTFTTTIRFTAPIDPRAVWARVADLVCDGTEIAPSAYRWEHTAAHQSVTTGPNPSIWADMDQGATAWARMSYGAEGSLLIEDDEPELPQPPAAYVELRVDTCHGEDAIDTHAAIVRAFFEWSNAPIVFRDDYTEQWMLPYWEVSA